MRISPRSLLIITVLATIAPGRSIARPVPVIDRPLSGSSHALAPDGVTAAERLSLDPGLIRSLSEVAPGESIGLVDWPIEIGRRSDVLMTRREVYAPDAKIYVVDGSGTSEASRSGLAFLFGEVTEEPATSVLLVVDPKAERLDAFMRSGDDWIEIHPFGEDASGGYLLASSLALLDPSVPEREFSCGEPELPGPAPEQTFLSDATTSEFQTTQTTRQLTLAVDTDNELMNLKFSNNASNAANYIASLFALMSVVYERDLQVRLLQGSTILRVSSTPDPYLQSSTGNADQAKLMEFRDYWIAHYSGVSRASAMMLSGKQGSASSSSGIAYVNTLCSSTGGYSFSQVFKFTGSTASSDLRVVAHEVGHNFGSKHTHCYLNPTPIDTCYSGESGCYSGATSCPAPQTINGVTNVRGTLMSYCHRLGGCSSSSIFHPRTVSLLAPIVESKVGVCVSNISGSNPKEASAQGTMRARRGTGSSVIVTYTPACGATQHTAYAGNLSTLRSGGIAWSQRYCSLGTSGSLTFTPSGSVYFVVVANNGTKEGSYGRRSTGSERPPAGSGGGCSYVQNLSGSCP